MLTLTMILVVVVLAAALGAGGALLWMRYQITLDRQEVDELIAANRASARPGMAQPDPRFRGDMCVGPPDGGA